MPIENYLKLVDESTQQMVLPIIKYIETKYANAIFDEVYSEKSKIPTWRMNDDYVGIGCRKNYISIYFGNSDAVDAVSKSTPFCRANKGCLNFSYRRELPYEAVFKGIDVCFNS